MRIGDILDAAFRLYRNRFGTFIVIALVVYVPYSAAVTVLNAVVRSLTAGTPLEEPTEPWWQVSALDPGNGVAHAASSLLSAATFLQLSPGGTPSAGEFPWSFMTVLALAGLALAGFFLFMVLVYPISTGALVFNISAGYLGEELSAVESYKRVLKRLFRLLGAQGLVFLLTAVGFVLCVVPGVIFSLWFMLVPAVVLLEDVSAIESLGRSRRLMAGNLGKGFLLGLIVWILTAMVTGGTTALLAAIPWPHEAIRDFLTSLVGALPLPLSIGVVVLLYYDLRIRKEGFDLEHLALRMSRPRRP